MFVFDMPPPAPPVEHNPACIVGAAASYNVPPEMLVVIRMTERGATGLAVRNTNGSYDYGPNQINTVNLPTFHAMGVTTEQIRDNECINVYAAAYLLQKHLSQASGNPWAAMMRYHSMTPSRQSVYLNLLINQYRRATSRFAPYMAWIRRQTLLFMAWRAGQPAGQVALPAAPPPPPAASQQLASAAEPQPSPRSSSPAAPAIHLTREQAQRLNTMVQEVAAEQGHVTVRVAGSGILRTP